MEWWQQALKCPIQVLPLLWRKWISHIILWKKLIWNMSMLVVYYFKLLSLCKFIHLISKCLLRAYYVPITILGSWDGSVNQTNIPSLMGLTFTWETDNKRQIQWIAWCVRRCQVSWKKKRWRRLLLEPAHSLEPKGILFLLTPINLTTTRKLLKKKMVKQFQGIRRVMREVKGEGQCSQF